MRTLTGVFVSRFSAGRVEKSRHDSMGAPVSNGTNRQFILWTWAPWACGTMVGAQCVEHRAVIESDQPDTVR